MEQFLPCRYVCTYLQSTNDCRLCHLMGTKFHGVILHWWLSAGRGETCHMQTHTLLSLAEIKVEESVSSPCMQALSLSSIFQNVCKDNVEFSFHTWQCDTEPLLTLEVVTLRTRRECESVPHSWIGMQAQAIFYRNYTGNWEAFLAARIRTREEKCSRRLHFLGKHVFNSYTPGGGEQRP